MVVGFNHNFSYKGQVYHVQTEDSGVKNPHIITLLYRGGTILASKKTSYADIIKVDHLESVVEELMKSQHREMLRLLKNGDFDELLGFTPAASQAAAIVTTPTPPSSPAVTTPPAVAPDVAPSIPPSTTLAPLTVPPPVTPAAPPPESRPEKKESERPSAPAALSLDDIILSYMVGEERKK